MAKKIFLIALVGISVLFINAGQAVKKPVKWKLYLMQTAKLEYDVIIKATIQSGWYIWPTKVPQNGPIATSISIQDNKDIQLIGKLIEEPTIVKQQFYEKGQINVKKYAGSATFIQKIRLLSPSTFMAGKVVFVTFDEDNKKLPDQFQFATRITP